MAQFKKLYEDDHILAVSKPRGILTVGNKPGQKNMLDELRKEYEKKQIRLRPLNRLDRDTSGIVLTAKTKSCFHEAIEKKKFSGAEKTYIAIVKGSPKFKKGKITFPLPSRQDQKKLLPATTEYNVVKTYFFRVGTASLVEAKITSGRFHQIRRHFAMIHHPLLMDMEYMEKKDFKYFKRIMPFKHYMLHSERIKFKHFITGEQIEIKAEVPREFRRNLSLFS